MDVDTKVDGLVKKGLDSIIILGAWTIWKHRNISCIILGIKEELHQWSFAGARGVSHLLALRSHVT